MLRRIKSIVSLHPKPVKQFLDAKDFEYALTCLSKAIKDGNPDRVKDPIRVVVAGGVCSVMILHNRPATRDIDYFTLDPDVIREIGSARFRAAKKLSDFPGNWMNPDMLAFVLNHVGCEDLFDHSVKLNIVLWQSDVLVLYVADWRYQLVGKIQRAFQLKELNPLLPPEIYHDPKASFDDRHLQDAIFILRILIEQNQGQPLKLSDLRTWYSSGPALEDAEIEYVNTAYQDRYHEGPGISFDCNLEEP